MTFLFCIPLNMMDVCEVRGTKIHVSRVIMLNITFISQIFYSLYGSKTEIQLKYQLVTCIQMHFTQNIL